MYQRQKEKEAVIKKKKIKEMKSQRPYYNQKLSIKSGEKGTDLGHQLTKNVYKFSSVHSPFIFKIQKPVCTVICLTRNLIPG